MKIYDYRKKPNSKDVNKIISYFKKMKHPTKALSIELHDKPIEIKYSKGQCCEGVCITNEQAKSKSRFRRWLNNINWGEKIPSIKVNMNTKAGWYRVFLHEVGHYVQWLGEENFRLLDVQHKEEVAECYYYQYVEEFK